MADNLQQRAIPSALVASRSGRAEEVTTAHTDHTEEDETSPKEDDMKARELMTANPACCTPGDPAQRVAQLMADNDCGCIPVVADQNDTHVVGVVTDRDIAIRGVAKGRGPDTPVRELMTGVPFCCPADADVKEVERVMAERQVRRVVVVDDDGCCVGVISQADLARAAERRQDVSYLEVARVVERISEPATTPRAGTPRQGRTELRL
jgi:CBS domain-containing protein